MQARVVLRSLVHRIIPHPGVCPTYTGRCISCSWSAEASKDEETVDLRCMVHASSSNHRQFTRTVVGRAFVVREGEDDTPPSSIT